MLGDHPTPWDGPSARRLRHQSSPDFIGEPDTQPDVSMLRRYRLVLKIASGGMGSVYLGFQCGAAGFRRPVAIKRAHPHLLEDESFRRMLVREARLASLVRHPNVASVSDVDELEGELLLIMDYVEGAPLSELMRATPPLGAARAMRVVLDACHGLDALHRACDERGQALGLVHRDVSPQNILVGVDGLARVADLGIAKAYETTESPGSAGLRGKPAYMAPEYIATGKATPASDVFALAIVAWEILTGRRLFKVGNDMETLERVRYAPIPRPSTLVDGIPPDLEDVIMRGLARSPAERFGTADEMAKSLEAVVAQTPLLAGHACVGRHVQAIAGVTLEERRRALMEDTGPQLPAVAASSPGRPSDPADDSSPSVQVLPPRTPAVRGRAVAVTLAALILLGGAGVSGALMRRDAGAAPTGRTPPVSTHAGPTTGEPAAPPAPSPAAARTAPAAATTERRATPPPRRSPAKAAQALPAHDAGNAAPRAAVTTTLVASPPAQAPENPYP